MKAVLIPLITLLLGYSYSILPETGLMPASPVQQDTTGFDQDKALAQLREQIKGKEDLPSSEVWKNIQMFGRVPAGRLLNIMENGYSRSRGVTCDHCHDPKDYTSDRMKEKLITREMAAMVRTINQDLLGKIEELGERPTVNCTTCHRGDIKPALNMN